MSLDAFTIHIYYLAMTIKSFKGGVHPPEHKDETASLPVKRCMPSTGTVWIPVTQGGSPNRVLVQVGDVVARGQKLAETDAFIAAPVHASIAGTVKKIETRLVAGNMDALCIAIEADGSDRTAFMDVLDPALCGREQALARVKEAGVVGMGGAAFPAHVKLNPPKGSVIDFVIANAAECEPFLTIDARTIIEHSAAIVDGLAIAMQITGAPSGIIAIEANKLSLIPILEKAIAGQQFFPKGLDARSISIVCCKTKYPQGGEKMLVKAVTGREVPSGGLPSGAGCVVQNVGTLKAISEAFRQGKPLIDRCLTVSGGACATPKNIEVPIGTLAGDLIPGEITLKPGVAKIISGGPMMGVALKNANFPIQKNTSGLLFLTASQTSLVEESACIGCGRCLEHCPCRLSPVLMVRSLKVNELDEAKRYGLMDCMECGCCSYVCPSRIKLVQRIRIGKHQVRAELLKQSEKTSKGGR